MQQRIVILVLVAIFLFACTPQNLTKPTPPKEPLSKIETKQPVILGNESLLTDYIDLIKGKRIGLVTNPSGVNSKFESTADILAAHPDVKLQALFGPEHGIRGAIYAGDKIEDEIDSKTGLPVFSLYGKNRKPTKEMLQNIDVLIVDIQDIGVRAYTYIYTMAFVMQAAAEFNKPVLVLDRPNPLGGIRVEGNLVEDGFSSFVGLYPIPYRHGMTIGELALLFNTEFDIKCDLTVIPLKNWIRDMLWDSTGLFWIPPSPHVPHWETVLYMSTTGTIGELHTISEGVGYTSPFEMVGAPWVNADSLADELNNLHLNGILFRPIFYKPYYGYFKDQNLQGVQLHITNPETYNSYVAGFYVLETLMRLYPEQDLFAEKNREKMFYKVIGCDWIVKDLKAGVPVSEIQVKWQNQLQSFLKTREKYLLY